MISRRTWSRKEPSDLISKLTAYQLLHLESDHFLHTTQTGSAVRIHPDTTRFSFHAYDVDFEVELEKNLQLLGPNYSERREVWRNGKKVSEKTVRTREQVEHCFYRGYSTSHNVSKVAGQFCYDGFRGTIHLENEKYIVEPTHLHFSLAVPFNFVLFDILFVFCISLVFLFFMLLVLFCESHVHGFDKYIVGVGRARGHFSPRRQYHFSHCLQTPRPSKCTRGNLWSRT